MGYRAGDYLGGFLSKEDFVKPRLLEIRGVEEVEVQGEARLALKFHDERRSYCCNATALKFLREAFGDDSDEWLGKRIVIGVDPNVEFSGRRVGGLRLRLPRNQGPPEAADPRDRPAQAPSRRASTEEAARRGIAGETIPGGGGPLLEPGFPENEIPF